MVPFFLSWTVYGNVIFIQVNEGDGNCQADNNDTFAFIMDENMKNYRTYHMHFFSDFSKDNSHLLKVSVEI